MSNPRTKTTNLQKYEKLQKQLEEQEQQLQFAEKQSDIDSIVYNVEILKKQLKDLEPYKDLPNLSKTCQTFLKQKYIELMYNRRKDIDNKYMRKGRECEEEGITLYSSIKKRVFKNNKLRVSNAYFTGEIDIPIYNAKQEVEEIADVKNAYDAITFIQNLDNVKPENEYQGHGYMDLYPTCKRFRIANVLVNNTHDAILQALHYESYKWPEMDTPTWRELEIAKNHIYTKDEFIAFAAMRDLAPVDDKSLEMMDSFVEIPAEARLIEHVIERNEAIINDIKIRIDECRKWMKIMFNLD